MKPLVSVEAVAFGRKDKKSVSDHIERIAFSRTLCLIECWVGRVSGDFKFLT